MDLNRFMNIAFNVVAVILVLFFAFQITRLTIIGELTVFGSILCYLILGWLAYAVQGYVFKKRKK